jgi:site-specific DNA recombinase
MPSTNGRGPKRAILYARVSTDEQARSGYSLAQQLEALREYAAREGYEVLEEVSDPGQSGASLERPGMDRVRDLVAAGGVSVVLAQDRDRFAREPAYHYLLRKEFEEHGTKIRALNDRGDESPEGELTDGILDQLAKYERAKIAERTRRGKLRRAREGKIIPVNRPNYGFKLNAARDNYVVDEEEMHVVRRIFRMVGAEAATIHAVKRILECEGVPTPTGKRDWGKFYIRSVILDDVYRPHSRDELKAMVDAGQIAPEVFGRLDPDKHYGIWWFNRERASHVHVTENGASGKRYRKRATRTPKPEAEWIAVPVPDSGVPRELVDAAREVIAKNRRTSRNGGRVWELSGGVLRCAECGWTMRTTTVTGGRGSSKRNFYYRCNKHDHRQLEGCANRKSHRADRLEPLVWEFVSGLLKNPDRLRAGLDEMIRREREVTRGNPDRDAKTWAEKIAEVDQERRGYLKLAARGCVTDEELDEALAELGEARETAERELAAIEGRRERLEALENDRDTLMEHYAGMVPEALESLSSEERRRVYMLLKLTVALHADSTLEASGVVGGAAPVCDLATQPP